MLRLSRCIFHIRPVKIEAGLLSPKIRGFCEKISETSATIETAEAASQTEEPALEPIVSSPDPVSESIIMYDSPATPADPGHEVIVDKNMESPPPAKLRRQDTNYKLCIICQSGTDKNLIVAPISHKKLLDVIHECAVYGDGNFPEISRRLGNISHEELELKSATWHRKCYQNTVHAGMCRRAKERYEKILLDMNTPGNSSCTQLPSGKSFTRSQSVPFNKDLCFFCENPESDRNRLHKVSRASTGKTLYQAIQKSGNEKLYVKLCTSVNPEDAQAIGIRYHKGCWATHVSNIDHRKNTTEPNQSNADILGAQIEFLNLVESTLMEGNRVSIALLQDVYEGILSANNVENAQCYRKKVKQLIEEGIPSAEFHKPKRMNEPECVTLKSTKDAMVQQMKDADGTSEEDMLILYNAASILRKVISNVEKLKFAGSLTDATSQHIPKELYCFFRWVIQGPSKTLLTDNKSTEISKHAQSLAKSTIIMSLSSWQVNNTKSQSLKLTHEMPQQLAVGVAIRQAIRSKKIVNMLHGFGMSVGYTRLLRMEGQILNAVLQRVLLNDGVYLPPDVVHGRQHW